MKNVFCSIRKNGKKLVALFAILCFTIGNVAFIPAVEANAATVKTKAAAATIKSVVNPPEFYADNQTSPAALQKALPQKVSVVMSDGSKSTADVAWNIKGYVSYTKTSKTYDFTGTVKGTKLTAKIKVVLANPYISSVKAPTSISVANGTKVDKLNLPGNVTVVKSNKITSSAKVVWDTSKYNGNAVVATSFVLTGNVEGTEKTTKITVKVGAPFIVSAVAPKELTVENGTTYNELNKRLPKTVAVKLSNGLTSTTKAIWITNEYYGDVAEETTYSFIGYLEDSNQVTTSIKVKVTAPSIVSVKAPDAMTILNGTSIQYLKNMLPKTVEVTMSNALKYNAKVTWDTSSYDPSIKVAKNYVFTGVIEGTAKTTTISVISSAYVEVPYVVSVVNPQAISVLNGTQVSALELPSKVVLNWSSGATSSADVTWNTTGYDGNTTEAKAFSIIGTFAGTERTAAIIVNVGAPFIVSVVNPDSINVLNGTTASGLQLPAKVNVNWSNRTSSLVDVSWNTSAYDGNTFEAKAYSITGTIVGTEKTAIITVNVGAPFIKSVVSPAAISVPNGTAAVDLELPEKVDATWSNGTKTNANVDWDTTGYNGNVLSAQSFNLSGTVEGTDIKAALIVNVGVPFVVSAANPADVTVDNGTTADKLILPDTVEATLSNGVKTSVAVTWNITEYNGNVEEGKTYIISGTVTSTNITTKIKVVVRALWTLKWSDEFDGANGNGVDSNKWIYEIGNGEGGWGNAELEYYTDSTNNVFQRDGNLVIKAIKEPAPGGVQQYTSGKIATRGKFSTAYGKIEARIKSPVGQGFWSAFWMMPANDVYGGWASSGEIDIMENRGRLPGEVYGTLHYGSSWPNNKNSGGTYNFPEGQSVEQFHVYTLEWEPGEFRWLVDGEVYQTQNNWYTKGINGDEKYSFPAPFDQDFYVILDLAIGGYFDGLRPMDDSKLPGEMVVDYVRAYDLTGRPYKTPVDPVVEQEPLPAGAKAVDETGNYLSYSNFPAGSIVDNPTGGNPFEDKWNFVHIPDAGGNGTQSIDTINGTNYAKIDISAAGSQNYAVQLIQRTTLGKERWYKLSFDAKASAARNINAKASGGEDRGWTSYSDLFTYSLGTDFKHYESIFKMTADTDLIARIEFELGLNKNSVWIGNVRLEETSDPATELNASKNPLPASGNYVYNGAFDKGSVSRMDYWNFNLTGATATASVPERTRQLVVDIVDGGNDPSDITVDQRGIQLVKNSGYSLTFKAAAAAARTAKVQLVSQDGATVYAEKDINLTTTMTDYELVFETGTVDDLNSKLVFLLGGDNSDVYLDNVSLVKTTVDYTGVDLFPLKNGTFAQEFIGWETFKQGADAAFAIDNGAAKVSVATVGTAAWNVMLINGGMSITRGIEYTFSYKAKASVNRDILVTMENASYQRAFDQTVQLTQDWQTFTYTVKPTADDNVALKFQLGKTAAAAVGDVYIDDVVFQVKNPPVKQSPMLVADDTDNLLGNSIDITSLDDAAWRAAITSVKINNVVVLPAKYTITAGNINLAADNFAAAGTYTVTVEAAGYAATSVSQTVLPNDGKIVVNGTFDTNYNGWGTYIADGSDAVLSVENGELKISFTNYDGYNVWSTQINQSALKLTAGKAYVLKFDARATQNKDFKAEITNSAGGNHLVTSNAALTTTMQTFTFEFTPGASDTNAKLVLMTGSGGLNAPNFANQSIFLDNIRIEEKVTTPPVEGNSIIKNGSFDTNTDNWTAWWGDQYSGVGAGDLSVADGKLKIHLTAVGGAAYAPQVLQEGFQLENGKTYVVKFKAKADAARAINVNIGKGLNAEPWFRAYAPGKAFDLTASEQEFTYTFTVKEATDPALKMVFEVGKVGAIAVVTDIYLDDISLSEVTAPVVNKAALAAKISEVEVKVQANYTVDSWTALQTALTSAKAVNTKADATQVEVDAALAALTSAITGLVAVTVPGNTNLVVNGDFAAAITPWTNWSDGSIAVAAANGEAKIDLNGFGTESWSVQFAQNGFNFEPNVKYNLSFKARASVARSFGVDIEGAGYFRYMDKTDNLTTDMKTYSYEFTITKGETTKMNFFFGKTGADITDALRSTPQTIYLDDVVITKVDNDGETPPTVSKIALAAKITDADSKLEAAYTTGTWAALQTALTSAKAVNTKADATQVEVDAAVTALTNAINGLVAVTIPGDTDPSKITVEAESATAMDPGFTTVTDSVTSSTAGTFSFNVNILTAGTYKVTVYGKCSPAGVYYELRNSTGGTLAGIGAPPSQEWTSATFNVTLTAGEQTMKLFCAAGAGSVVFVDKITLELQ
jgi:beta-glucanase (GH16 family)